MHKKILTIILISVTAGTGAAIAYALSGSVALAAGLSLPAILGGLLVYNVLADREKRREARRQAREARRRDNNFQSSLRREKPDCLHDADRYMTAHIRAETPKPLGTRIDQVSTGALAPDDVNYIYRRIRSGIVNKVYKDTHRLN